MTGTSIPIDTPFRAVIERATVGERGHWRERKDGWRFWLEPVEPNTSVMLRWSGSVDVMGRLADKVIDIPGGTPADSGGYVGLKWKVREAA